MKKPILLIIFLLSVFTGFAQTNDKETALNKAQEAIELMDDGKIEESMILLKEAEKLDPKNYMFPYEMAYAYVMKEDFETAIKILKKIKKYKPTSSQVYQMSGNCYSFMGKPDKAIKEYEEGMKHFPNAGNLYLERGNIYLQQENYYEAIKNYNKGIEVDPEYPSNYFRLAKLFLNSKDRLSGIIYGEIFMNIERTTPRTREMSELLFNAYTSSITLGEDESEIDFCVLTIDSSEIEEDSGIKLPFCGVFGKNFILATIGERKIDLKSLANIRKKFIENYFEGDHLEYPNVLLSYQKKMLDNNLFNAYNHYIFQMGAEAEFDEWMESNETEYEQFVDWYTDEDNYLMINNSNKFIR